VSLLSSRTLVYLLLPPMMWAGNAVVGRMMVGSMPPVAMNALRWLLVALMLWPLVRRSGLRWGDVRARWRYLALIGTLGVGTYNALQYLALQTSSPLNVTLIGSSVPVWMMIVGRIGFGQSLQARQLVGAALSVLGVMLVMAHGDLAVLSGLRLVPGDMLMLLASLAWAVYSWLLAHPPAHMVGERRPAWDWAAFLFVQVAFGSLWAVACSGVEAALSAGQGPSLVPTGILPWLGMLFIAVGPSIVAYRCWGLGVQTVGPTMAAFFSNLTPIFAAVWAALLLGEHPRWYHPVALLLIVAGIAVSSGIQKRRREPPRPLDPKGG
jgi:drug/metabolite transporter (DMT)-like permease